MNKFKDKVELTKQEYLHLLKQLADEATENENERVMVHVAKLYMDLVVTTVTSGDEKRLAYSDDSQYYRMTMRLLEKANEVSLNKQAWN